MVAEVRRNGRQLVLFTNERQIYRHINKSRLSQHKVRYFQDGKLVGIDFYFDRKFARTIKAFSRGQMPLGI
jgi:hypothetical protein